MHGHHYHLMDQAGLYQGARFLNDEEANELESRGWQLVPVGDAHLTAQVADERHS